MLQWEHFEHEADIGVRGYGATPAEAFAATARAMLAVICEPDSVRPEQAVTIECEAPDLEFLLYDWLNALVYEMATRRMLFSEFEITLRDHRLSATVRGEPLDLARHQPVVEVKGATYTELTVQQLPDGRWCAQCVVDI